MKLLFQQILLTVLISYTIATPAPTIRNTRRTAPAQSPISCTYAASQENPNAACWNQLDLTGYLDGWNNAPVIAQTILTAAIRVRSGLAASYVWRQVRTIYAALAP